MGKNKRKTRWRTLSIADSNDETASKSTTISKTTNDSTSSRVSSIGHSQSTNDVNNIDGDDNLKYSTENNPSYLKRNSLSQISSSNYRTDYRYNKYNNNKHNTTLSSNSSLYSSRYSYRRRPFSQQNGTSKYYSSYGAGRATSRGNRTISEPMDSKENSSSLTKPSFNEDDYTRITTPRQDVIFKKGYFSQPKKYISSTDTNTTSSAAASIVSTEESMSATSVPSLSPEQCSQTDSFDPEQAFMYSYVDQNGVLYVNPCMPNGFDQCATGNGQMFMLPYGFSPYNMYPQDMNSSPSTATSDQEQYRNSVESNQNLDDISLNETSTAIKPDDCDPSEVATISNESENDLKESEMIKTIEENPIITQGEEIPSGSIETYNYNYEYQQFYPPMYYPCMFGHPYMPVIGVDYDASKELCDVDLERHNKFRYRCRKRGCTQGDSTGISSSTTDYSEDDEFSDEDDITETPVGSIQEMIHVCESNESPIEDQSPHNKETENKQTKFNADVPEFIPRSIVKSNLNVNVKEFLPKNYKPKTRETTPERQKINSENIEKNSPIATPVESVCDINEAQIQCCISGPTKEEVLPPKEKRISTEKTNIKVISKDLKNDSNQKSVEINEKSLDIVSKNETRNDIDNVKILTPPPTIEMKPENKETNTLPQIMKSTKQTSTTFADKVKRNLNNEFNNNELLPPNKSSTPKKSNSDRMNKINNNNNNNNNSKKKPKRIDLKSMEQKNFPTYAQMLNKNQLKNTNDIIIENKLSDIPAKEILCTKELINEVPTIVQLVTTAEPSSDLMWQTVKPKGKRGKHFKEITFENEEQIPNHINEEKSNELNNKLNENTKINNTAILTNKPNNELKLIIPSNDENKMEINNSNKVKTITPTNEKKKLKLQTKKTPKSSKTMKKPTTPTTPSTISSSSSSTSSTSKKKKGFDLIEPGFNISKKTEKKIENVSLDEESTTNDFIYSDKDEKDDTPIESPIGSEKDLTLLNLYSLDRKTNFKEFNRSPLDILNGFDYKLKSQAILKEEEEMVLNVIKSLSTSTRHNPFNSTTSNYFRIKDPIDDHSESVKDDATIVQPSMAKQNPIKDHAEISENESLSDLSDDVEIEQNKIIENNVDNVDNKDGINSQILTKSWSLPEIPNYNDFDDSDNENNEKADELKKKNNTEKSVIENGINCSTKEHEIDETDGKISSQDIEIHQNNIKENHISEENGKENGLNGIDEIDYVPIVEINENDNNTPQNDISILPLDLCTSLNNEIFPQLNSTIISETESNKSIDESDFIKCEEAIQDVKVEDVNKLHNIGSIEEKQDLKINSFDSIEEKQDLKINNFHSIDEEQDLKMNNINSIDEDQELKINNINSIAYGQDVKTNLTSFSHNSLINSNENNELNELENKTNKILENGNSIVEKQFLTNGFQNREERNTTSPFDLDLTSNYESEAILKARLIEEKANQLHLALQQVYNSISLPPNYNEQNGDIKSEDNDSPISLDDKDFPTNYELSNCNGIQKECDNISFEIEDNSSLNIESIEIKSSFIDQNESIDIKISDKQMSPPNSMINETIENEDCSIIKFPTINEPPPPINELTSMKLSNDNITIKYPELKETNDQQFPLTHAVLQWLNEESKEKTPEPIFRIPNDLKLSTIIESSIKQQTIDDVNFNNENYDIDDDDIDENWLNEENDVEIKSTRNSKNLKSNPSPVSSVNYQHQMNLIHRQNLMMDNDSDYNSDSQQRNDDNGDNTCERVAAASKQTNDRRSISIRSSEQLDYYWDDDFIRNPQKWINNNNNNNNIIYQNNRNHFERELSILSNTSSEQQQLATYESVYGKTINYDQLIINNYEFLSNNIRSFNNDNINNNHKNNINAKNTNITNNINNNDKNDTSLNNNFDNNFNNKNNTNNCLKPPPEVCCILM